LTGQSAVAEITFAPTVDEKTGKVVHVDKQPKIKKFGLTDGAIKHMADRAKMLSLSARCATEIRAVGKAFIKEVLTGCDAMTQLADRRTISANDVVYVLDKHLDIKQYGFGSINLNAGFKPKKDDDRDNEGEDEDDEETDEEEEEDEAVEKADK